MEFSGKNMSTKARKFEMLVDFLQQHSDLAKGQLKTATAKMNANHLWKRLGNDLNAAGPPSRDVGWKKVWADYKNHLKTKLRRNKTSISDTGGGPSRYCPLNALEEQVSQLLCMNEAVSGMSAMEFGIVEGSSSQLLVSECGKVTEGRASSISPVCTTANASTPQRGQLRSASRNKEILIQKQVHNQIEYQENSIKVLKDIRNNLKDLNKNAKRKLELEEKKHKVAKEKFELKKSDSEKRKLLLKKIEIKQQMLDIEA